MKSIQKILIGTVLVLGLLFIFKNVVIKTAVTMGVRVVAGMKLDIDKLNLSISKSFIDIEGIKLYNSKKYPDPIMADIPKVFVDIDLKKAFGGNIHIEKLELNLKEFVIVKNKDGEININDLKTIGATQKKDDANQKKKKTPKKSSKKPKISVDNLHLKIGKVVYKDYSKGAKPVVKEYKINLDEHHENIKSIEVVMTIIIFKVVTKTNIAALINFDLGGLQDVVTGTFKNTTEAATKAVDQTADLLKNTVGALKDKIKLPFGR